MKISAGILICLSMGNKQDEPERKENNGACALPGDYPKQRAIVRAAPSERSVRGERKEEVGLSIKGKYRKPLGKALE